MGAALRFQHCVARTVQLPGGRSQQAHTLTHLHALIAAGQPSMYVLH